jgi:hypothetical protein
MQYERPNLGALGDNWHLNRPRTSCLQDYASSSRGSIFLVVIPLECNCPKSESTALVLLEGFRLRLYISSESCTPKYFRELHLCARDVSSIRIILLYRLLTALYRGILMRAFSSESFVSHLILRDVTIHKTHNNHELTASIIFVLMMEAASKSEILVNIYQTTWHKIEEDSHVYNNSACYFVYVWNMVSDT